MKQQTEQLETWLKKQGYNEKLTQTICAAFNRYLLSITFVDKLILIRDLLSECDKQAIEIYGDSAYLCINASEDGLSRLVICDSLHTNDEVVADIDVGIRFPIAVSNIDN